MIAAARKRFSSPLKSLNLFAVQIVAKKRRKLRGKSREIAMKSMWVLMSLSNLYVVNYSFLL